MRSAILNVVYHNFETIRQVNNVVLAKCSCCTPPRWGVFVTSDKHKIFYYHGYDFDYAKKLFEEKTRGEIE